MIEKSLQQSQTETETKENVIIEIKNVTTRIELSSLMFVVIRANKKNNFFHNQQIIHGTN